MCEITTIVWTLSGVYQYVSDDRKVITRHQTDKAAKVAVCMMYFSVKQ